MTEHPPYLRHHFNSVEQQADASSFAMWLFLLTESCSSAASSPLI